MALTALVGALAICGWRATRALGSSLLLLYAVLVAQDVGRSYGLIQVTYIR